MTGKVAWHRSYGLAAALAMIVASAAFVSYRNHSFRDREHGRARAAAEAIARGDAPLQPVIAAELVGPAEASSRYPFLRKRRTATGRVLGGARGSGECPPNHVGAKNGSADCGAAAPATDKLIYDAAQRVDRTGRASVGFLRDGSGWVVAALPARGKVAVAITEPPEGPEGYPWLVVLGLLAMGALVAAAGALVGGRAHAVAVGIGASGLAVPAYLWAGWIPGAAIAVIAVAVALADARGLLARAGAELARQRIAYTFVTPAVLAMLVLVATPFVIGLALGFYDHHNGEWAYVGLDNFARILSGGGRAFDDPLNFWFTLGVTVLWTVLNVALHVVIGVALAVQLQQSWLRGRTAFRMLLILPWAIPNYITALIWHGMFQGEYGAVNGLLGLAGLSEVSWFSSWSTAFAANLTTNTWLGFPFMMVVAIGALESIPRDMYEAAEVDGASRWQRFWHITVPHLRPALAPAIVLGAIWTFNMFNVIYLVSEGRPGGSTDILVTEAYRWAFERGERYGLASAYATIIFAILLLWTVFGARLGRRKTS